KRFYLSRATSNCHPEPARHPTVPCASYVQSLSGDERIEAEAGRKLGSKICWIRPHRREDSVPNHAVLSCSTELVRECRMNWWATTPCLYLDGAGMLAVPSAAGNDHAREM